MEPPLWFERKIDGPATHALIVGVSDYANLPPGGPGGVLGGERTFGLKKLESPALSALRVAEFLKKHADDLAKPLATVRLLVCTSAKEREVEPALRGPFVRPTFALVKKAARAWQKAASSGLESLTFFYFAGHGIERTPDSTTLLFDDIAEPGTDRLEHAVELKNIVDGMAPTHEFPEIARTQFYFNDSCRSLPEKVEGFSTLTPGFFFSDLCTDDSSREQPIFYATRGGTKAHGVQGDVSYFCKALLMGLESGCDGADETGQAWPITVTSLECALQNAFQGFKGLNQEPRRGGASKPFIELLRWKAPPPVRCLVHVRPSPLVAQTRVHVEDASGKVLVAFNPPPADHPYATDLPLGDYTIVASAGIAAGATTAPAVRRKNGSFKQRERNQWVDVT